MDKKKYNWYAIYTKPRSEKKLHTFLTLKGMESYCPLTKVKKRYSDRTKVVEEPLFKSYVFVNIAENQISEVKLTEGFLNFVYWLKKPAIILEEDILTIKKFLKEYSNVKAEPIDVKVEQKIVISSGLLMDHTGVVKKVMKHKVIVALQSIGFNLVAEIDKKDIVFIN